MQMTTNMTTPRTNLICTLLIGNLLRMMILLSTMEVSTALIIRDGMYPTIPSTSPDPYCVDGTGIKILYQTPGLPRLSDAVTFPIEITTVSSGHHMVTFIGKQVFDVEGVNWLTYVFSDVDEGCNTCIGPIYNSFYGQTNGPYQAECDKDGKAIVHIFVRNEEWNMNTINFFDCGFDTTDGVAYYRLELSCQCTPDDDCTLPTEVCNNIEESNMSRALALTTCEDHVDLDFSLMSNGEPCGTGYVSPDTWSSYGFLVHANTDPNSSGYTPHNMARYYQTDTNLGVVLIIHKSKHIYEPSMNPDGGQVCFDFGNSGVERLNDIVLFDVGGPTGAVITIVKMNNDVVDVVQVPAMNGASRTIDLNVANVLKLCVNFSGNGGIANLGLCKGSHHASTPSTFGNLRNVHTLQKTISTPKNKPCSSDIELIHQVGGTELVDLTIFPFIEIIEQPGDTVTFQIKQMFTQEGTPLQYFFIQYHDHNNGDPACENFEYVPSSEDLKFTAYCMQNVSTTSIDIWVSDTSFLPSSQNVTVPDSCYPDQYDTNEKIQYSFILRCDTNCLVTQ